MTDVVSNAVEQANISALQQPPLIDVDPPAPPAAPAEVKKEAIPAATDENANPTDPPAVEETPEQKAAKAEARTQSRRAAKREREVAAKAALETEVRILREQNAALEAKGKTEAPAAEAGEPKREAFENYEDYLEARTDWRADQKVQAGLKVEREARETGERQRQQQTQAQAWQSDFEKREVEYAKTVPDYVERVREFVKESLPEYSPEAKAILRASDLAPNLMDHLEKNPDEHDRIVALPALDQAVELKILERELKKPKAPAVKKPSDAPAPIKPVAQGASGFSDYNENMTTAEYEAWRKQKTGKERRI